MYRERFVFSGKSGTDNRNLQDSDSNQKMSKDDILKLKEDGATGEVCVWLEFYF